MGSNARTSTAAVGRTLLRPATKADLAEVVALERACYGDPWPASAFASLPANEHVFFAVARQIEGIDEGAGADGGSGGGGGGGGGGGRSKPGRLAGYVVGWYVMDEGELANLAVAPDLRCQGIGRLLLNAMLQNASSRGVSQLYLEVRESNAAARQLYSTHGFETVGRRKRYYRSPTEDALILRRQIKR